MDRGTHCSSGTGRPHHAKGVLGALTLALLAFALLFYTSGGNGLAVGALSLLTDRDGYLAGDTVNISGSGFAPYEGISLQVTHQGGGAEADFGHEARTIYADANGAFAETWSIGALDNHGNKFVVSAAGDTSGAASASFSRVATIQADKFDYLPDNVAHFDGYGFFPNESVELQVSHINSRQGGSGHDIINVPADAGGHVAQDWLVSSDDSGGALLVLKARGIDSGLRTLTIFMDSTVTVVDDQGADDYPGQKDLNQLTTNS